MNKGIKVSVQGAKQLIKDLNKVTSEVEKEVSARLAQTVTAIHRDAIKSIRKTSVGSWQLRYNKSGETRQVIAAKPGEPPNTDTGTLVKSIGFNVSAFRFRAEVGTNLKYGKWLEFGTRRMKARPWLDPALKKNKRFIQELWKRDYKYKGRG